MLRKYLVLLLAVLLASCSGIEEDDKAKKLMPGEEKKLESVSNSFRNALMAAYASDLIWTGNKSLPTEVRQGIERNCTKTTSASGNQITVSGPDCPIRAVWSTVDGLENQSEIHFQMNVVSGSFLRLLPIRTIKFDGMRLIENRLGKPHIWSNINGKVVHGTGEEYTFESVLDAPVNSRTLSYRFSMFFADRTIRATIDPDKKPSINGEDYNMRDFEILVPIIY